MDLHKRYNNPKLEARRKKLLLLQKLDRDYHARKRRERAAVRDIPPIETDASDVPRTQSGAARRLVAVVHARSEMIEDPATWRACERLVDEWKHWIACPEAWRPRTYNVRRQLASFARHLLCRYDVPACLDSAWLGNSADHQRFRGWFIHMGSGQNIRNKRDLPFPFTKRIAHEFANAPAELDVYQAVRRAQVLALGGDERLARTLNGTRLGLGFDPPQVEAFWETVIRWLVRYPLIAPDRVGPLIDYLHNQKFTDDVWVQDGQVRRGAPEPGLTMKDRQPQVLLQQVERWHGRLNRAEPESLNLHWPPSGVPGYERIEGEAPKHRVFRVQELLSSAELKAEGRAMRHCVYTYARSCAVRQYAIYSMQLDDGTGWQRRCTVRVDLATRRIIEARGRFNAPIEGVDQRILAAWMTTARLIAGRFAW